MSLLESIVLGIVQGLTEFLPVSSSAHLLAVPWLMNWSEPPFVFDTSLHIGTLVALFIFFREDIFNLTKGFFKVLKTRDINSDFNGKLSAYVLLGSIPAGLMGLLFEKKIETVLHSPYIIVVTLITWGILLWTIDKLGKKEKVLTDITIKDALFIGLAQALALVPGTSRSGVTITAALFSKFDRETAARFSFLLSIPITTAAALYKLKDLFKMNITTEVLINFSCGVVVSGVVGYICIAYLLKFLKTKSYAVFAIYRIFAGILLAITIPQMLHTKIEIPKVAICNDGKATENLLSHDKKISIPLSKNLKITPIIENLSKDDLKDLYVTLETESKFVLPKNKILKYNLASKSIYPSDISCNESISFDLELVEGVSSGTKIPLTFTVINQSNGRRADFNQDFKVE